MTDTKPLHIGFIGTGWVADAHIDNFKQLPNCEITAVCSRKKARAEAKIREAGLSGAHAYSNIDKFLSHPGLDVVVICTPHPLHAAQTISAANAGKHIVIEKPVALNPADLKRMVAAVNKAGVKTSVCFELRWVGLFKNIKSVIEQGLIGPIFYAEASYYHGIGPWYGQWSWNIKKRIGGDALLTAGCHALDALIHLLDSRVVEVSAMSSTSKNNPLQYEYAPNSVAILKFENGAIGKVATSIECRQPYLFPVLIQGEHGTVWNDKLSTTKWPALKDWATLPADMPDSGDVADHPYHGQLEHFVDCIRSNKRPKNNLNNAAHTHEVIFAIDSAIKSKKTVRVKKTPGT